MVEFGDGEGLILPFRVRGGAYDDAKSVDATVGNAHEAGNYYAKEGAGSKETAGNLGANISDKSSLGRMDERLGIERKARV